MLPKFLAYLVILCFERRYPKQNTVARLTSKELPPVPSGGWWGGEFITVGSSWCWRCETQSSRCSKDN